MEVLAFDFIEVIRVGSLDFNYPITPLFKQISTWTCCFAFHA